MKGLEDILALLPGRLRDEIRLLDTEKLEEIRLRAGGCVTVRTEGVEYIVLPGGGLARSGSGVPVTEEDISIVLDRALESSFYSYRRELAAGHLTLAGGCRIGLCGTAVLDPAGALMDVRRITSLCIRIPREIFGCGEEIYRKMTENGLKGILIAGAPGSGKTTCLRDLIRLLAGRYTVAVIDERQELAGAGNRAFDLGTYSDILSGYPRYEGIISAVRSLCPRILVCDEIGTQEDVKALSYAANSGAVVAATCHCERLEGLREKKYIAQLMDMGLFGAYHFLQPRSASPSEKEEA